MVIVKFDQEYQSARDGVLLLDWIKLYKCGINVFHDHRDHDQTT